MPRTQKIISLIKELVTIRSTNSRKEQLLQCADFLAAFFSGTSLTVERFLHNEIPSLFISKHGNKHPRVLLYGHFDVVDGNDAQFEVQEKDGKLFGRGVFDMKGPLAILMLIMKELADTPDDVGLMLVGDEEIGGVFGAEYLLQQNYGGDVIIMPDGGMAIHQFTNKEKGILRFKLTAHGKAAHSSVAWKGDSAIDKLIATIDKIHALFVPLSEHPEDHWVKTFSVGELHGGVAYNQVPDSAYACCEVRFTEQDVPEEFIEKVKSLLPPDIDFYLDLYCPANDVDSESELYKKFVACVEDIGRATVFRPAHGSSDARYFSGKGMRVVIISQPDGGDHHGPEEWVDIGALTLYDRVVRKYIDEVAK